MRCGIWYHLYNLKIDKNTHGGALILAKLQAKACKFTKINTPPWVFLSIFKLYKWYQIAQRITDDEFDKSEMKEKQTISRNYLVWTWNYNTNRNNM